MEGSSVKINGASPARIRYGYQIAAELSDWTLVHVKDGWTLTATVRSQNAYRVAQCPLTFEATHAKGVWRWPVRELRIEGARCDAVLGLKER